MMICGFDSNKVSKSLKFCQRENQFIPFSSQCMAIKYGSKLVHFIRMRVPIYMILNTSDYNSYLKYNHEYGERTGLVVRASDSRSGDPGSILSRVGVLFP